MAAILSRYAAQSAVSVLPRQAPVVKSNWNKFSKIVASIETAFSARDVASRVFSSNAASSDAAPRAYAAGLDVAERGSYVRGLVVGGCCALIAGGLLYYDLSKERGTSEQFEKSASYIDQVAQPIIQGKDCAYTKGAYQIINDELLKYLRTCIKMGSEAAIAEKEPAILRIIREKVEQGDSFKALDLLKEAGLVIKDPKLAERIGKIILIPLPTTFRLYDSGVALRNADPYMTLWSKK